jgi:hypothetical protein
MRLAGRHDAVGFGGGGRAVVVNRPFRILVIKNAMWMHAVGPGGVVLEYDA